jgi:hypothetical protein
MGPAPCPCRCRLLVPYPMSSAEAGGWTSNAIQHNLKAGCMGAMAGREPEAQQELFP